MRMTTLGKGGPTVSAVGLGCMGLSGTYGPADDPESIATIHAALDAGITLIDTGDFYGMGHNEMLLQRALAGRRRDSYFLCVKFGAMRAPNGAFLAFDGRPAAVKNFLAYSLQRLGTDYIDLYQPARVDPNVPIEETVGAIADAIQSGWVRHIGLSEASSATIRRATAVHPIRELQIEYSLASRGVEADILPTIRELSVSMTAYGVFSRGLLTGSAPSRESASRGDIRALFPRFQGENLERNKQMIVRLEEAARDKGATVAQLAAAWVISRGTDIIPLFGARTRQQLADGLKAVDLSLTDAQWKEIEKLVPPGSVAGDRYGAQQMNILDSEKPPQRATAR